MHQNMFGGRSLLGPAGGAYGKGHFKDEGLGIYLAVSCLVVNFDLGERFPRPRFQQRGSLRPRARRVAVLGAGVGGGCPLPLRGSGGVTPGKLFEIFDAKSRVRGGGQFGPENKLFEG